MIDARVLNGALRITVSNEGVYVFDLEGRPAYIEHGLRSYVRGLSGAVLRKSWAGRRRIVEEVTGEERERLLEAAYGAARRALQEDPGGARGALELTSSRGIPWLREDERRFREIYLPVSILPPDQYLSIYLQATIGCSYNRCSFCVFYRDRSYRARDPREFRAHAELVKRWLGAGLLLRRGVFLGDANPLGVQGELALEYVRIAAEAFPGRSIYAFADYFSTRLDQGYYSRMRSLGLKAVYLGLESGSEEVLRLLNKPPEPRLAVRMAKELLGAGVARGIIVLVGAGGRRLWREHVRRTLEVLDDMDLGQGDVVFLSRLEPMRGAPYFSEVADHLTEEEMDEQQEELESALRERGLRTAPYDVREFVY